VNTGAATLILPFELAIELLLKWLEVVDIGIGGAKAE
jgi:hypothetical protein